MQVIKNSPKYYVWQGNINKFGYGNVEICATFSNLEDAKDYFDRIKKDTRGYILRPCGHLETWLTRKREIDDNFIDYFDYAY